MISRPIRILAVDDHPAFRHGLAALIGTQSDMQLVAEAGGGREAIDLYAQHCPDITLMDLRLPDMNGILAIKAIRNTFSDAKIIVLTTYAGAALVTSALRAGAQGFLVKTSIRKELIDAIHAVHAGQQRIHSGIEAQLAQHATDPMLTDREVEVIRAIAEGYSNRAIGRRLKVSEETIKSQVSSILAKLNVSDRTQAVVAAIDRGYLEL